MWFLVAQLCACTHGGPGGNEVDAGGAAVIDAAPGTPDGAPGSLARHVAGPYKAYLGTIHDHHYAKNGGDDGGLKDGAADEPGFVGSSEWFQYRRANPDLYIGGDATSAYRKGHEAGLDFFSLTPHSHLTTQDEFADMISKAVVADGVPLYGQEWSSISSGNHAIIMNASLISNARNGDYGWLLSDWFPGYIQNHPEASQPESRPYLILAHPDYTSFDYTTDDKARLEYGLDDFASRDAWVTGLNARARLIELVCADGDSSDQLTRVLELLNEGITVGFSVGQDNHRQRYGTRSGARIGALAAGYTRGDISEALYARRTYASEDTTLGAHLAVVNAGGDRTAWMGEEIVSPGSELTLEVGLEDTSESTDRYTIRVMVDELRGGSVAQEISVPALADTFAQGTTRFTIPTPPAGGYLLVHVTTSDGESLWFSPIWIR
jgi:hypothetical protein